MPPAGSAGDAGVLATQPLAPPSQHPLRMLANAHRVIAFRSPPAVQAPRLAPCLRNVPSFDACVRESIAVTLG